MITGYPAENAYLGTEIDGFFMHRTGPFRSSFIPLGDKGVFTTLISTGAGNSGGARGRRMRTLTALPCLIGVVRDSWQQGYFSVHPIRKEWVEMPNQSELLTECPENRHQVHLSENWSNALKQGLVGSSADIAEQVGMTSGQVRKIIRLNNLPLEVFDYLKGLDDPRADKKYTQRRLSSIAAARDANQVKLFEEAFSVKIEA